MAQKALDEEAFFCSGCLNLLKDPVTIPCGHSYCMNCVQHHWDQQDEKHLYSCPVCHQSFSPRPGLVKTFMLASIVEQLKKTGLIAPPADRCYAGPQDVSCDVCTGRKLKAVQSCRQCVASYCESHLKPHEYVAAFQEHQLVALSHKLQENISSQHDEMKKFCHSYYQRICALCEDQHRGREIVLLLQSIVEKETALKRLKLEVSDIKLSALKSVQNSEDHFREMESLLEKRCLEVEQHINCQDQTRDASLSTDRQSTKPGRIHTSYFEKVTTAVSALKQKLQLILSPVQALLFPTVLNSREDFLQHYTEITLDPKTANAKLSLSHGNRRVTLMKYDQVYSDNVDRFSDWGQVLSRECLTGRCYWEVEWSGKCVYIAVSYRNIQRKGNTSGCLFGFNNKSTALVCHKTSPSFLFNSVESQVSGPVSSRIGVYLDHSAGMLVFYSVSESTMSLLHRVQTTFTESLSAGIWICWAGDAAHFPKLK